MSSSKILDADGHIVEQDHKLLDYFDPPYRGNKKLLDTAFHPSLDGWHRQAVAIADGKALRPDEGDDLTSWLAMMDRTGIEKTVLYPSRGLASGFIRDPDWAVALCRAHNNFAYEYFVKASPRFHAIALLPMLDVQEAVKELHRAVKELNAVGGVIAPVGLPFPAGHPIYHPVFAAAEELGCPIGLHGAPATGLGVDILPKLLQARVLTHPFAQLIHLTSIVLEGVLEKYPKLRIVSLEAGSSWLPFLMERLDLEWEKRKRQAPLLKQRPTDYLTRGQFFVHCDVVESTVPAVISKIGENQLLYASDYPHERDQEATIGFLRNRDDISEQAKEAIFYHNAKRLYKLD